MRQWKLTPNRGYPVPIKPNPAHITAESARRVDLTDAELKVYQSQAVAAGQAKIVIIVIF